MENINLKIVVLLAAAAVLTLGCPAPSSPPAGTGSAGGTVRDSVTGAPIQGATVVVGADSALTDAAGSFNFAYSSGAAVTGDVFVYKGTAYQFWGTTNVQLNVAANPVYSFYLVPANPGAYPAITVSGQLPVTAGNNAHLNMVVENAAGGIGSYDVYPASSAAAYSLPTATYGADCIVAITYKDDNLASPIIQYYQHVDLSVSATLDIIALLTTTVSVNGTTGDLYMAMLDYGPCDIPNYVPAGMLLTPTASINVYDGDNLPLIWTTGAVSGNTPISGYQTVRYNFGPSVPFTGSVTLPAPASTVAAPSAVVEPTGITWTAGTRTIAFTPAAGATLHVVQLSDNGGRQGRFLVNAPAGTCVLPADFITNVLGTGNGWDCLIMPIASNRSLSSFVDLRIGGNGPVNIVDFQLAMVMPTSAPATVTDLIP